MIKFCHFMSLLVWNLFRISKPYILCSSKEKLQNYCLKNKVFSWGKCWNEFIEQYDTTFTLRTNSLILETKPLKGYALSFTLMKRILLLLHTNYSFFINIRYMAFFVWYKNYFKEYPSRMVCNNDHFQMVIVIDMLFKKYKMHNPAWSSPNWLSRIASHGRQVITCPFLTNTPTSSTRSHSIPHHWHLSLTRIFEFPLPIPLSYQSHS